MPSRIGCAPRAGLFTPLLLIASCAPSLAANPPREPNQALPQSFAGAQVAEETASPAENLAHETWAAFFADPDLKLLIDTALVNNQELNMRLQEIIIAKSEVMERKGEYLPRVQGEVGAGVEKVGERTRFGVLDEHNGIPQHLADYRFGLAASWEVDIWKKLRNAAKAANYRYLSSIEGRNFMVTQLVAEIASSYYELLAFDSQLEVLKSNIELQQSALEMAKLQKEAARVTQLAVQRFEAEVLKNQSLQYELEQKRVEAENRINFLLARPPQPVKRNLEKFREPLPDVVRAGLPAQLLDNRPDVRQAALDLEAAKLDVKSAKANFYPSLSIDADVGYQSFNIKHLLHTPASMVYNVAGNLVAPLLNRRAIKAQYFTANALQLQAVINYERTLLKAYTEVVNGLAKIQNLKKGFDLQSKQVDTLTQSIEVSNVLFLSARADYMEVLLTRRDSLDAQMELIETQNQQKQAMVEVYQALGGGWKFSDGH